MAEARINFPSPQNREVISPRCHSQHCTNRESGWSKILSGRVIDFDYFFRCMLQRTVSRDIWNVSVKVIKVARAVAAHGPLRATTYIRLVSAFIPGTQSQCPLYSSAHFESASSTPLLVLNSTSPVATDTWGHPRSLRTLQP